MEIILNHSDKFSFLVEHTCRRIETALSVVRLFSYDNRIAVILWSSRLLSILWYWLTKYNILICFVWKSHQFMSGRIILHVDVQLNHILLISVWNISLIYRSRAAYMALNQLNVISWHALGPRHVKPDSVWHLIGFHISLFRFGMSSSNGMMLSTKCVTNLSSRHLF